MPARAHKPKWREVGRIPVTLVQHKCECGCGRRRVSIVAADGRGVALSLPELAKVAPGDVEKIRTAVSLGRELLGFWQRAKALAGGA
jgi:hypothetical protein